MSKLPKLTLALIACCLASFLHGKSKPLNVLYIMTDDHAATAVGAYGSRLAPLNPTPTLDALAADGILFNNCFSTNSICTPSRASILSGQYSQTNGVLDLDIAMPADKQHLPVEMKKLGYQTAIIGKWHLNVQPNFDYWKVLVAKGEQGTYFDPVFIEKGMKYGKHTHKGSIPTLKSKGHSSDVITDNTIEWLENGRDKSKPFFLMHHYKAPHDMFENAPRYDSYLEDTFIPEPASLYADPTWGSAGTRGHNDEMRNRIGSSVSKRHDQRSYVDNFLENPPSDAHAATSQSYQTYLKRYLRCVKGVDDNIARLFEYLKENDLWDNTIIIYTTDQGMMLGEHDLQDKRWIYEESIHMPFIVRHPNMKERGIRSDMVVNNVDFTATLIELVGGEAPEYMQSRPFAKTIETGKDIEGWKQETYYRYWMHLIHHDIPAHFGIRTDRYKLVFFYGTHYQPERMGEKAFHWIEDSNVLIDTPVSWELYDLKNDPTERVNLYDNPEYKQVIQKLKIQLKDLREELGETDEGYPHIQALIEENWDA